VRSCGSSTLTLIYYNAVSSSVGGAERAIIETHIYTAVVAIIAVLRGDDASIKATFHLSLRIIL